MTDHEFGGNLLTGMPARDKRNNVSLAGSEGFAAQLTFDLSDARHPRLHSAADSSGSNVRERHRAC